MPLGLFQAIMRLALTALIAAEVFAPGPARADEALWAALKSPGHIAFIRHALAPGTGDPANFRLGDCATQRNLSDAGQRQARRTGDRFRANGIGSASVYSSQWCRCLETARLLGLGEAAPLPPLNSIHGRPERTAPQLEALRGHIASLRLDGPVVMSTHHSVIVALTGAAPRSGEIVVVRRDAESRLALIGKIAPSSTE